MFMNVYLTTTPKKEENNLAYLENNIDVISELMDVVPYAKSNTDILLKKEDLEKILENLKNKRDTCLSTAQKSNIEERVEALQLILDNFDFNKNFLYIYYE